MVAIKCAGPPQNRIFSNLLPLETLGHYSDWLGLRTQRLRDLNGLPFQRAVVIGQRIQCLVRPVR